MILSLGPMAGYTDAPFRDIIASMGANHTVSEMVSAVGLMHAKANINVYNHLLAHGKIENNLYAQIFGNNPLYMAEACRKIADMGCFCGIDINMGCPVKKIVNNGEGSALMQTPKLAGEIVKAMVKSSPLPVSVKMRIGWDSEHINALSFAKVLADNGASLISIHGRTREQMYSGNANWDIIADVKSNINIPVIANGDIVDAESAKAILTKTNADGIMIARASIGNPWVFAKIKAFLYNEEYIEPNMSQKGDLVLKHIDAIVDFYGVDRAVKIARSQMAHYFCNNSSAKQARVALYSIQNIEELKQLVNSYFIGI